MHEVYEILTIMHDIYEILSIMHWILTREDVQYIQG